MCVRACVRAVHVCMRATVCALAWGVERPGCLPRPPAGCVWARGCCRPGTRAHTRPAGRWAGIQRWPALSAVEPPEARALDRGMRARRLQPRDSLAPPTAGRPCRPCVRCKPFPSRTHPPRPPPPGLVRAPGPHHFGRQGPRHRVHDAGAGPRPNPAHARDTYGTSLALAAPSPSGAPFPAQRRFNRLALFLTARPPPRSHSVTPTTPPPHPCTPTRHTPPRLTQVGDRFVLNCLGQGGFEPLMKHFLKRFAAGADRFEARASGAAWELGARSPAPRATLGIGRGAGTRTRACASNFGKETCARNPNP